MIMSTSDTRSSSLLMNAVLSVGGIYSLCSGEKEKANFSWGIVLVITYQTLRLVMKRVKLIRAFSVTGSNVTHLAPQDSKGTDPN